MITSVASIHLSGISEPPELFPLGRDLWSVSQTHAESHVCVVGTLDELSTWLDVASEQVKAAACGERTLP